MAIQILFSLGIIVATIFIHGLGTAWWLNYLFRNRDLKSQVFGFYKILKTLSTMAVFLMVLHFIEIALWAGVYMRIPALDKISHWEESIYFSMVTYTTLGYGDITLPPIWRIMSGFEAMNGILLFGWSTTMFFAVVQKIIAIKNNKN